MARQRMRGVHGANAGDNERGRHGLQERGFKRRGGEHQDLSHSVNLSHPLNPLNP